MSLGVAVNAVITQVHLFILMNLMSLGLSTGLMMVSNLPGYYC
jgi:hypothetical protein